MSKFNSIINSFSGGEVGRKLDGRTDIEAYAASADTIQDFFVLRNGGAQKRPGTRFISDITLSTFAGARVIPFVFSKTEAYTVVFTDNVASSDKIKVFNNSGVEATVDVTQSIDFAGDYDPKNWQFVQSADVLWLAYSDSTIPKHVLIRTAADTFDFVVIGHPEYRSKLPTPDDDIFSSLEVPFLDANVDPDRVFSISAITVGTGRVVSITDSNGDSFPIFEPGSVFSSAASRPSQVGTFLKATAGTVTGVCFVTGIQADQDVTDANINTTTNVLTTTTSTGFNPNTGDIIELGYANAGQDSPTGLTIGQEYFIQQVSGLDIALHTTRADAIADTNRVNITALNGDGVKLIVKKVGSANVETIIAFDASLGAGTTDDWEESAWSAKQGFPKAITIHEQRLVAGGTLLKPDTFFGSLVNNFFHFMETKLLQDASSDSSGLSYFGALVDSDPYQFTIGSTEVNSIQWMSSQNDLQIGTLGAEYIATGGSDTIISRSFISVRQQTAHGSSAVQPVRVNDSSLFVSADGKRIRDFAFLNNIRAYQAKNLNLLNDEIVNFEFDGLTASNFAGVGFQQLVYQESRSILWALTTRGSLLGLTLDKDSGVTAWHKHIIAGADRVVKGITVIPSSDGSADELWLVVERTVNSSTERYLEQMGGDFEHTLLSNTSTNLDDKPWFSDSAIRKLSDTTETFVDGDVSVSIDTILFSSTVDQLRENTRVQLTTTGTLPTGLSTGTDYFIAVASRNSSFDTLRCSLCATATDVENYIPTFTFVDGNVTTGDDAVEFTGELHTYSTGDKVQLTTSGALPAGLSASTDYYIIKFTNTKIKFASSLANAQAGTAVDITSASGGGTHTITPVVNTAVNITAASGGGTHTITEQDAITWEAAHLIGETVTVLGDGFPLGEFTVDSNGDVTLPSGNRVSEVIMGLPYTPRIKTLRIEAGADNGSAQGNVARVDRAIIRLYKSYGLDIGSEDGKLKTIDFRKINLAPDAPLEMFTGDKEHRLNMSPNREPRVILEHSVPLPLTIVALILRGVSFD